MDHTVLPADNTMPERFVCTLVQKALYKYSSFPFLSFPFRAGRALNQAAPTGDVQRAGNASVEPLRRRDATT